MVKEKKSKSLGRRTGRWLSIVLSFVGIGGIISLAAFYLEYQDRKDTKYQQALKGYENKLEEWESWAPPMLSRGTIIVGAHRGIDLETGRVLSNHRVSSADLFYTGSGYWESKSPKVFVSSEYLRALNNTKWVDKGRIPLSSFHYGEVRDANYSTRKHTKSNLPDLFHGLPDDSPIGHVFLVKTGSGNVAKLRLISYDTQTFDGGFNRLAKIEYITYPTVSHPPKPTRPRR